MLETNYNEYIIYSHWHAKENISDMILSSNYM